MSLYEKNSIGVICWNDSGLGRVISNAHADLLLTAVKHWDSSPGNHIKINCPHCIKKYNKHMGKVDSLDALVSAYQIGVMW